MAYRKSFGAHFGDSGFSLIELMAALLITGILLSVGMPAFGDFITRIQTLSASTELLESITLARQYAVSSHQYVSLCGSTHGSGCDGGWHSGVLIYSHDGSARHYQNPTETPKVIHYKSGPDTRLKANISSLTFRPSGILKGRSGSLLFCPKKNTDQHLLRIVISRGGRIRSYDKEALANISYLSDMRCG